MILPRHDHAAGLVSPRNASPQEKGAFDTYEAKGADEWEINKRSVTANFPLHQKNVLFLVATILRSSKK